MSAYHNYPASTFSLKSLALQGRYAVILIVRVPTRNPYPNSVHQNCYIVKEAIGYGTQQFVEAISWSSP